MSTESSHIIIEPKTQIPGTIEAELVYNEYYTNSNVYQPMPTNLYA
jgi:hypothetical protein